MADADRAINNKNFPGYTKESFFYGLVIYISFYNLVYDSVIKIPRGKVATYGQVASMCGSPRAARAVGYALHFNPMPGVIPCHRVVDRFGRLADSFAFGGISRQKELLVEEGVDVSGDFYVDLKKFQW